MANYAYYVMKLKGTAQNCDEWVKRMRSYEEPNHFWRIFEVYVDSREGTDEECELYISGDCAWSLESCCRASGYSNGIDLFAVNSKELNIEMEAYSRETGFEFEEHYIYRFGDCVMDECLDIIPFYWDKDEFPTYDEFKKEYPSAPPEDYFTEDNGMEVIINGFGEDFGDWNI